MAKAPDLISSSPHTQLLAMMISFSVIATIAHGWMPRLSTSSGVSKALANGVRSGIDSLGGKSMSLFMNNNNDDSNSFDEKSSPGSDGDDVGAPRARFVDGYGTLFAEDVELHGFVSRLEAIYGMNSDASDDEAGDRASIPFWEDEVRLILEGWMDWSEGPCLDECCGFDCDEQCEIPEEYKLTSETPKVDVMSFLGIRRAEPLRVGRDWD